MAKVNSSLAIGASLGVGVSLLFLNYLWQNRKEKTALYSLKDKVVIITGASAGIGKALAFDLASKGAKLVLAARRTAELEQVAASLPVSAQVLCVKCDVTVEEDCRLLIEKTVDKFCRLDVLINNAGISQTTRFEKFQNLNRFHEVMEVNYFGTLNCTFHAWKHLKHSTGMVVAVSSVCGKVGVPTRTGYCASKFAIHGFLESLRLESQGEGVHILLACPGYVKTDIRKLASTEGTDMINEDENLMSATECAKRITQAMETKQREVIVVTSVAAKLAPLLHVLMPDTIDKLIIEKQKGGRT